MSDVIADIVFDLRENHRLKLNCDYSYTIKYDEIFLLVRECYKSLVLEKFKQVESCIVEVYSYK